MPHPFGNDERGAAENDRNVVVPSQKGASFEVVESELAFEIFVDAFGPPTFLDDADDLFFSHATRQRRKRKLRRFGFALRPLHEQPYGLTFRGLRSVIMCDLHASQAEPRRLRWTPS